MASYYYLIGQLPSLSYGSIAPMGSNRFREMCAEFMPESDFELLDRCVLDPSVPAGSTGSNLIDTWTIWERTLRANLARSRAARLKRDTAGLPEAAPDPLDAAAAAKAAVALESPLEAEQYLDRARWVLLDSLLGLEYFSRDTAYAYMLKLLLLERKALFRSEEGFAEYKAIYASVMEAAPTSIASGEPK
ncbi:MAG: hypothetical protein WCT14_19975 [Treponemataceae bacterium]